jgi:hypothetical protein
MGLEDSAEAQRMNRRLDNAFAELADARVELQDARNAWSAAMTEGTATAAQTTLTEVGPAGQEDSGEEF